MDDHGRDLFQWAEYGSQSYEDARSYHTNYNESYGARQTRSDSDGDDLDRDEEYQDDYDLDDDQEEYDNQYTSKEHVTQRGGWNRGTLIDKSRTHHVKRKVNFPVMRKWIGFCNSNHMSCNSSRNSFVELPTRLVDVGKPGEHQSIRLIESNGQKGQYAALTYCWGDSGASYITTTMTIDAHKQTIPWDNLPRTVQDAIKVTQRLGIQYLWVDALCIVQGQEYDGHRGIEIYPGDWEREASRMASIYLNAYITIAATEAADCREGFLKLSSPYTYAQKSNRDYKDLACFLEGSHLYSRGWTFQETTLSHRIIHFTKDGLIWFCKHRIASEDGCYDNDPSNLVKLNRDISDPYSHWTQLTWWSWIEDYTSRQLRHERDRLAAIAGITEYFGLETRDKPVLGLWKRHLHWGLLWQTVSPARRTQNSMMQIPTWSWLSVRGKIKGPTRPSSGRSKLTSKAEIVKCEIQWVGHDLTGKIAFAKLVLRGPLHPATLRTEPSGTIMHKNALSAGTVVYQSGAGGSSNVYIQGGGNSQRRHNASLPTIGDVIMNGIPVSRRFAGGNVVNRTISKVSNTGNVVVNGVPMSRHFAAGNVVNGTISWVSTTGNVVVNGVPISGHTVSSKSSNDAQAFSLRLKTLTDSDDNHIGPDVRGDCILDCKDRRIHEDDGVFCFQIGICEYDTSHSIVEVLVLREIDKYSQTYCRIGVGSFKIRKGTTASIGPSATITLC